MNQFAFAQDEHQNNKKITRREQFLAQMETLVPWQRQIDALSPSYFPNAAGKRGRPPIGLGSILRIYFLQQWYGLADDALEDAIYDSQAMRDFVGIDLAIESVPDATTFLSFRYLLGKHALSQRIFVEINASLAEQGLCIREGTIDDATILAAAPSTQNKAKQRDPEIKQTKKGNQWSFCAKADIGINVFYSLACPPSVAATRPTQLQSPSQTIWLGLTRSGVGYLYMWSRLEEEKGDPASCC